MKYLLFFFFLVSLLSAELHEGYYTPSQKGAFPIPYFVHVPDGYQKTDGKELPVILYLHGRGRRSDNPVDLHNLRVEGTFSLPLMLEMWPDFSAIVLIPLCSDVDKILDLTPVRNRWPKLTLENLMHLLDEVIERYGGDPERVSLTGLSMGAMANWRLIFSNPNRFAAIMPISSYLKAWDMPELNKITPIHVWAFQGQKDFVQPLGRMRKMIQVASEAGGIVRYTEIADRGHIIWDRVYSKKEPYRWLIQQWRYGQKDQRVLIQAEKNVFTQENKVTLLKPPGGIEVKYSFDGQKPGDEHGVVYEGPFIIKSRRTILARAKLKKGWGPVSQRQFEKIHSSRPLSQNKAGLKVKSTQEDWIKGSKKKIKSKDLLGFKQVLPGGNINHLEKIKHAVLTGYLPIKKKGRHTFVFRSDHQAQLFVYNELLMENKAKNVVQARVVEATEGMLPVTFFLKDPNDDFYLNIQLLDAVGERKQLDSMDFFHFIEPKKPSSDILR